MSDIVENIKDLPTWLLVVLAAGIGIIVLIPVIIILAAVVGSFVLSAGGGSGDLTQPPAVQFNYNYESATNEISVTYAGGDTLHVDNVQVRIENEEPHDWAGSGSISPGDTTTIPNVSSGDTVRVIWTSDDEDTTTTIGTYQVP